MQLFKTDKVDKEKIKECIKDLEGAITEFHKETKKVMAKHAEKNPAEMSIALETSIQTWLKGLLGQNFHLFLINLLHDDIMREGIQDAVSFAELKSAHERSSEKPDYFG